MSTKRYRIEDSLGLAPRAPAGPAAEPSGAQGARLDEILAAIQDLRRHAQASNSETLDACRRELAEAYALRAELDLMKDAITRTKQEIATLHRSDSAGKGMRRVAGELDAVVDSTERATTAILGAIEEIETNASVLRAMRTGMAGQENIDAILDRVVTAYEACNFQDLTGQRIGKVVGVLKFVEEHLDRMIDAWNGLESFRDLVGSIPVARAGDDESALLNGPKLDEDPGHVDQSDIDALFG